MQEEIKPEAIEHMKDKFWRLNNLYFIKDKKFSGGKIVPFKMNEAQEHYFRNKAKRNIIGKSRQHGFTTLECIDTLDSALFSEELFGGIQTGFDALLITIDDSVAKETFDEKVKGVLENTKYYKIAKGILFEIDNDSANKYKFTREGLLGSSSILVAGSGRSGTFRKIHVSELGKISKKFPLKAKEILSGTIPSAPIDSEITIESTFEGEGGLFYEMFWEAWNRGEPKSPVEFKAHFYNWRWDKRDIARASRIYSLEEMQDRKLFEDLKNKHNLSDLELSYYYEKYLSLNRDIKVLRQEYPTTPEEACMSTGNKLIDSDIIINQPDFEPILKLGDWNIYAEYKSGHIYGAGVDVAEGVGQDSSTCVIIDFSPKTPEVVATYKNNLIEPDVFAYELKNGLNRYGQPIVGIERNNHGHATLAIFKNIYPQSLIYGDEIKDRYGNITKKKFGWQSNGASKPIIVFAGKKAIEDEVIILKDKSLKTDLRTYEKEDIARTNFDKNATNHWDLAIAFFICWHMRLNLDLEYGKETLQNQDSDYEDLTSNKGNIMDLCSPI